MLDDVLGVDARCPRAALAPDAVEEVHAVVRLRATRQPPVDRPRLSTVLVLDASGSMTGDPITHVIESATRLTEILADDDALGVVAFSDGAHTVSPVRALSAEARTTVRREIATLAAQGYTNMSGGLAHAALALPARATGERQLLLLLSDGHPNVGAATPEALADEVRRIKERGIAVSTLGYGVDHSDAVLVAIAQAGGGRYAFVGDPMLAGRAFAAALGAQRDVVAEDVRVRLEPSEGVEIVRVLGNPKVSFSARGLSVSLADLVAGDDVTLVAELRVRTPREIGPWQLLGITTSWKAPRTGAAGSLRGDVPIVLARPPSDAIDEEAAALVALARVDDLRTDARGLSDRGDFGGAAVLLKRALALVQERLPAALRPQSAAHADEAEHLVLLRDAYETLLDEIAVMEKKPIEREYQAWKKAAQDYAGLAVGTVASFGGSRLAEQSPSAQALLGRLAPVAMPKAVLRFVAGPLAGRVIPITAPELDIGRTPGNQIVLPDGNVSKRHARIVLRDGKLYAVDLKSTNALKVNGARVDAPRALADGDKIEIGASVIELHLEGDPPAA
ncbi:MAG: VWA domain-containing protein, partial [Deltaproteobacteria bacterium]|nr:VWA domain-containing protein [Deltaproteobacteria bacterium]